MATTILVDVNLDGHAALLAMRLATDEWRDFRDSIGILFLSFEDVGLDREAKDNVVWRLCQELGHYLLTANRNEESDDSLEATIRGEGTVESLPVLTLADARRMYRSATYLDKIVARLLDILMNRENYLGAGRWYLPCAAASVRRSSHLELISAKSIAAFEIAGIQPMIVLAWAMFQGGTAMNPSHDWQHPRMTRRTALQAGAIGLLGLGMNHVQALRATAPSGTPQGPARACIYIFLSGGLAQHESFDLKPDAPESIRGEFRPAATTTPGIQISEHLPGLARRSEHWAIVRSLTHPTNGHTLGHFYMLTGRTAHPPGFRDERETRPGHWPAIASVVGDALPPRNHNLPPAIVLPERLVHWSGGTLPGAYGGLMGRKRDPLFIEASPYGNPMWRGAYPEFTFPNSSRQPPATPDSRVFQAPNIALSPGMTSDRLNGRLGLLRDLDQQRLFLERSATTQAFDEHRQSAISLLADPGVRRAFDVTRADLRTQERYGRNSFGWSLLMAFRLVEAGVNMIQVNLGNNETWDTHGDIFPRLKDKLFPPTDRALCALIDDLRSSGLFDSTLIVMGSEFGRTPRLSTLADSYTGVGRDHWGAVQSVFFAGGGIRGGTVIGSSDRNGAYPASSPQSPENMGATIYHALGIPKTAMWHDTVGRPYHVYHGEPIAGLL